MPTERSAARYTSVAIILHWIIALLVIAMAPMGWWMVDAIGDPASQQTAYQVFQLHKSIGFAILALTLVRLAWRLAHPAPAAPGGTQGWAIFLAHATHVAFYGLLIALPLTGWIYVSAGWAVGVDRPLNVATSWFGLLPIPHLPGFEGERAVAFGAMGAHGLLVWGGVVLVAMHVGAALKHQFIDRDGVLARMVPFLRRHDTGHDGGSGAAGGSGAVATAAGLAAVLVLSGAGWALNRPAPPAHAPAPAAAPAVVAETVAPAPAPVENAASATAKAWTIDKAGSSIAFSGTHTGEAFEGRFEDWDGDIRFDPADLGGSKVVVRIRTASARTGDATQENSLRTGEWFNADRFPEAVFEAGTFRSLGEHRYEAGGTLTIKGKPFPVVLPFRLTIGDAGASMEGEVDLDRTALDLGMFSDAAAEWVSKTIRVKVAVRATPA
ncbi:MAG: cytochrome b/b6 domain-containing protein [Pseudochelatococcus sp.]|jgi:cytochrome b561/polyisoprenoid-binding protein YceI|uniref:cytochrome b/b6 domain-containing protein n=1 Tax=Pseudochelatococcus sp. TaxID=2020869 RepID=UPI003D93F923